MLSHTGFSFGGRCQESSDMLDITLCVHIIDTVGAYDTINP